MIVDVVAHPRASRRRVAWDGEALHVWVTQPATGGRANRAVLEAIAEALGVRPAAVDLVRGTTGRRKQIAVAGLDPDGLERLRVS